MQHFTFSWLVFIFVQQLLKNMKFITTLALFFLASTAYSQTHLTSNNEECWIVKNKVDKSGQHFYVVVVKTGEIENEKTIVERILRTADKESAISELNMRGFRVEIFRTENVTLKPKDWVSDANLEEDPD